MGEIGYFQNQYGTERFVVSDTKMLPVSNIQRSTAGRFNSFDRIGLKPLTDYTGPGLKTASFTISAKESLGVPARAVVDRWADLADGAAVGVIVIGNRALGHNKWLLKSAEETWTNLGPSGKLLSGDVNLSFEEYVDS